jgi:hypothetical protein
MKCKKCGIEVGPFNAISCVDFVGIYTVEVCNECIKWIHDQPCIRFIHNDEFIEQEIKYIHTVRLVK